MAKLKDHVAAAVAAGANYMKPGSGKGEVRRIAMYLDDIQRHLGSTIAPPSEVWGARVQVLDDDPGGAEPAAAKIRDGVFAVTTSVFILAHDVSLTSTQTRAFPCADFTAEPVLVGIKDSHIAGFRILSANGTEGSIVVAMRVIPGADGGKRRSLRDTFIETINGAATSQA